MGWINRILVDPTPPPHQCEPPYFFGKHSSAMLIEEEPGSLWVCDECGTGWVVRARSGFSSIMPRKYYDKLSTRQLRRLRAKIIDRNTILLEQQTRDRWPDGAEKFG
jgi:hypothetical protein